MTKKAESRRQSQIRKALEQTVGGRWNKIHGGPYQTSMLDLVGCVKGLYFELEVKEPGKKATERQQEDILDVVNNGGVALVVYTAEEAINAVQSAIKLSEESRRQSN